MGTLRAMVALIPQQVLQRLAQCEIGTAVAKQCATRTRLSPSRVHFTRKQAVFRVLPCGSPRDNSERGLECPTCAQTEDRA